MNFKAVDEQDFCFITGSNHYYDGDHVITANANLEQPTEGFYFSSFDYTSYTCLSPLYDRCYFLVDCYGSLFENKGSSSPYAYFIQSKLLIDEDAVEPLVFGCYLPRGDYKPDSFAQLKFYISVIFPYPDLSLYHRTQSPVFRVPPFPELTPFHSLFRSTTTANGIDIVLSQKYTIQPFGNLVLPMHSSFRWDSSGWIILRSRYIRRGLTVTSSPSNDCFHIHNHSTVPIKLAKRIFQYVPLSTYNFENLNNPSIINNWTSQKTIDANTDNEFSIFGALNTRDKDRESKTDEATSSFRA